MHLPDLHLHYLRRQRLVVRLLHPRTHRHFAAVTIGVGVMMLGSSMAVMSAPPLAHAIWDCISYFIHAVGTLPVIRHIEPLWLLLSGE